MTTLGLLGLPVIDKVLQTKGNLVGHANAMQDNTPPTKKNKKQNFSRFVLTLRTQPSGNTGKFYSSVALLF